jgi:hypothetical protein
VDEVKLPANQADRVQSGISSEKSLLSCYKTEYFTDRGGENRGPRQSSFSRVARSGTDANNNAGNGMRQQAQGT